MARVHRLTHPHLGVASWKEMEKFIFEFRKRTGVRLCAWCHSVVSQGLRTRCGKRFCNEMLWQAQSWNRCATVALRKADWKCRKCGRRAEEVDHKVPVCLGGTGDQHNLRPLCLGCHKEATRKLRKEKAAYVAA